MPNIREYSAPSGKINPDEKGYAAYETAGRRIGPLYNQASQDVEKGGKLEDQLISQLERETDAATAPEISRGGGSGRTGGGGVGGISSPRGGGGGYLPQSSGNDTFIDPIDAGNAAKWAAETAAGLTGKPKGGGKLIDVGGTGNPLYTTGSADSTPTASGSYSQQNPGNLSDTLDPSQIATDLKQGDYLYNQRVLGAVRASDYSPATLPYRTQNPAGIAGDNTMGNSIYVTDKPGFFMQGIDNAISNAADAVSNFTGGPTGDYAAGGIT